MNFHDRVLAVQQELKAPKDQLNTFGGFQYRSAEQILTALKPLLKEHGLRVHLTDKVVECGGRVYVESIAMISDGTDRVSARGYAREQQTKKGMDEAQVTGAASSYARKCALCGLLAIDDASQDPDAQKPVKDGDKIDHQMAQTIKAMIDKTDTDVEKFLAHFKLDRIHSMTIEQFATATNMLEKKLAAKN